LKRFAWQPKAVFYFIHIENKRNLQPVRYCQRLNKIDILEKILFSCYNNRLLQAAQIAGLKTLPKSVNLSQNAA